MKLPFSNIYATTSFNCFFLGKVANQIGKLPSFLKQNQQVFNPFQCSIQAKERRVSVTHTYVTGFILLYQIPKYHLFLPSLTNPNSISLETFVFHVATLSRFLKVCFLLAKHKEIEKNKKTITKLETFF